LANDFTIGTAAGIVTNFASTTVLSGYDVNTVSPTQTTVSASTVAAGVTATSLGKGSGPLGNNLTNTFGGTNWAAVTAADGAANGRFITFGLSAADTNTVLKLTALNPFAYRNSGTGPTNATLQYSIDGGLNFSDLFTTNGFAVTTSGSYGSIDLSLNGTVLQNVGTNGVSFRWVNFGATASGGTWYVRNITGDDLVINGQVGTIENLVQSGTGTLGIAEAGSATFSGNILNNNAATFTAASGGLATFSGAVSGLGSVTKTGTGTVTLSGNNSYSGGTTLSTGVLRLESATGAGTGTITQSDGTSTIEIDTTGTVANAMNFHNLSTLQTVTLSGNKTLNNSTYTVSSGTSTTESGVLSGGGGITKEGAGTLVVTASNTFTGATVVNAGVLDLDSSTGSALGGSTNVTVAATLLISQSGQVADNAAITLSGGTISRASGVSETFGALNLTDASALNFGSGTAGNLTFGAYEDNGAPSALLTVNNFFGGNTLVFGSDLSSYIDASYNGTAFTSEFFNINSTSGGFTSNWNGSTFTITAIPEPSTYAAAIGLLGLMLWPSRKRIVRDAKKILGFTPPMRDRLAAKRA
jgi:autotransporter-associated beta strand protein